MLSADIKLTVVAFAVLLACFFLVYFVFRMYKSNTQGDAAVFCPNQRVAHYRLPRLRGT